MNTVMMIPIWNRAHNLLLSHILAFPVQMKCSCHTDSPHQDRNILHGSECVLVICVGANSCVSISIYGVFVILLDGIKLCLCFLHWYVSTWIIINCPSGTGDMDLLQLQDIKSLLCLMFWRAPWAVYWSLCFCDYFTYKRWNHNKEDVSKSSKAANFCFDFNAVMHSFSMCVSSIFCALCW